MLRIDDVEYQHVLGLRLNVWTSIVLFVLAAVYFVLVGRRHPDRETVVYTEQRLAAERADHPADDADDHTADDAAVPPDARGRADPERDDSGEPGEADAVV
jgi:hypothetical protein